MAPLHLGDRGDSASFSPYVPTVFFSTTIHADYHRPSDTADRIDAKGIEKVVSFLSPIVWGLLDAPEKPAEQK